MNKTRKQSLWLAVVIAVTAVAGLWISSAAHALSQARLYGTITDETGKAVPGVLITVTCPSVASFKLETTSDDRGNWAVTLIDATKSYNYRYSKEGFQVMQQDLKVSIGSNDRRDFTMLSEAEARKRGQVESPQESTAGEKAVLLYNEGVEAFSMGDLVTARAKIEQSAALDPTLAAAYLGLAKLNMQEKKMPQVAEMAEKAILLEPTNVDAHNLLINALSAMGEKPQLAAAKKRFAEVNPEAGKGFQSQDSFNDGVRAYNAGDIATALKHFEMTLSMDPGFPKVHYMLGMCYISQGENAKAKQHLESFVAVAAADDPDATTAKEMLGYLK